MSAEPMPTEQEQFFSAVFGREQGYLFISTKDRSKDSGWRDQSFVYPLQVGDILAYVKQQDDAGLDVYVAAQLYKEPNRRLTKNVKICPSAWSDLDTACPWGVDPEPNVVLETSPGRWHGFWRTAAPMQPAEAEELSRQIAYAHHKAGADLGGWDLTQVLRIPGTHNHKPDYPDRPVVVLKRCDPTPIPRSAFAALPAAPKKHDGTGAPPDDDGTAPIDLQGADLEHWRKEVVPDRSSWAMRMVGILKDNGLSDRLVEVALANHPIYLAKAREKWGNKESLIYDDIRRCLQRWRETRGPTVDFDTEFGPRNAKTERLLPEPPPPPVFLRPISELLAMPEVEPDWLVDQLFTVGSNGWVAAEPKVGKSWTVLELVYALSTGQPFLGRFAVKQPRRVVYIQEEDSLQRVLRRFKKLLKGDPTRRPPSDEYLRWSIRSGFKLDSVSWLAKLQAELEAYPAEVVVMDVFNRLHALDENKQQEMTSILNTLLELNKQFGCAFILVHHNKKAQAGLDARANQMIRGSGVLGGWAECSLYLRRSKEKDTIIVTPESKDAPEMDDFTITLQDQENGGIFLEMGTVSPSERASKADAAILDAIHVIGSKGMDATVQRIVDEVKKERSGVQKRLTALVESGYLEADEVQIGRTYAKIYTTVTL
jgi:hypothetical protein